MKVLFLVLACACVQIALAQSRPGWNLVWNDEFNGPTIDRTKWAHEVDCWGGGNNELQCYTSRPDNSYIENGNLVLKAKLERYTGSNQGCTNANGCTGTKDYTSARLRTLYDPKGSWQYGRFEIRAKLPDGKGLWPAFWMLPRDYSYGPWAASGEIDIMEYRGQERSKVAATLHYGATWPNNVYASSGNINFPNIDFSTGYHVFACEWEENEMRFYVDDAIYHRVNTNKMWYANDPSKSPYTKPGQPWDKPFHILLNLAIGGGFFNGYSPVTTQDAQQWRDPTYRIDYVRVYQRSSTSGDNTCQNCCCNNCPQNNANYMTQQENTNDVFSAEAVSSDAQPTSIRDELKVYHYLAVVGIVAGVALLAVGIALMSAIWKKQQITV